MLRKPTPFSDTVRSDRGRPAAANGTRGSSRNPDRSWLVWGGTALTTAALTASTVVAARSLLNVLAGKRRPGGSPWRRHDAETVRFAPMTDTEHEQIRRHARDRQEQDLRRDARLRSRTMNDAGGDLPRPHRPSFIEEVGTNAASISNGVQNITQATTAAIAGFMSITGQAEKLLRECDNIAHIMRQRQSARDRDSGHMAPDADAPPPEDMRRHRL